MNCKKCGRPMGKKGYCAVCDPRESTDSKKKHDKLTYYILAAVGVIVLAVILAVVLWPDGEADKKTTTSTDPSISTSVGKLNPDELPRSFDEGTLLGASGSYDPTTVTGTYRVEIEVEGFGTIPVELDADAAPITVANFLNLVESGFYDGLTFHRVQEGFMMQGGDPLGTGTGGSDNKIMGEFSSNGFENAISHTEGTISMARSSANDSASSQFFICDADCTFLDGSYAAFGHVVEDGMDIVHDICAYASDCDRDGNSVFTDEADQPIITTITIHRDEE